MSANRIDLLSALAATVTPVQVEGLGQVFLRQISVAESDRIRAASKDAPGADFGLMLIIASVVDESGSQLFAAEDLLTLKAAADSKVSKLVERVLETNGYKAAAVPNVQS